MRNTILICLLLHVFNAGAQDKILKIHLKTGYTAFFAVNRVDSVTYGAAVSVHQTNGSIASFTTTSVDRITYENDVNVVMDIDDNVYPTVVIGTQTWIADNLRTTKYRNGTAIQNITDTTQWKNDTSGAWNYYEHNTTNNYPYGKLYNWFAVNNTNQICPTGWHVPSDAEWSSLITLLYPGFNFSNMINYVGGKMKSTGTQYWQSPNTGATNTSGWSGLPGGGVNKDLSFSLIGRKGYWWSSTENDTINANIRQLFYDDGILQNDLTNKTNGFSVRCLKDFVPATISTLNCVSATNNGTLTQSSAASSVSSVIAYTGGNGGIYSAQSISSTGVTGLTASLTAGTLANGSGTLTYTITGTPASSGTASFAISVGGQSCTFTRTVNSGTVSGITAHSCGATNVHNSTVAYGTMTDQEGNQYRTIQIGDQTWMAENLRTTTYRNGTSISNITDNTQWQNNTTGAYCSYNNNTANDCPYGKLYNWYAVNNANQLCPTGWHVPTDAEWTTMINLLDPNAAGGHNNNIAGGKMKSTGTQYWPSPNTDATNNSGFSGLPGGNRNGYGTFYSVGRNGYWWSSTENGATGAWYRGLYYVDGSVGRDYGSKHYGFSVRCLRD